MPRSDHAARARGVAALRGGLLLAAASALAILMTGGAAHDDILLRGDAISVLAIMRTFLETGGYYASPELAWPLGMDAGAYPLTNWGIWAVMTALRPFYEATEVYAYQVGILRALMILAMVAAYWTLRRLAVAPALAALGAVSFVAADFVAIRSGGHFFLLDIFAIPLAVAVVLAAAGRIALPLPALVAVAALAGLANVYWVFVAALLLALVVVGSIAGRRPAAVRRRAWTALGALLFPFAAFLVLRELGGSTGVPGRAPEEQVIYGLHAIQAFVPDLSWLTAKGHAVYLDRIRPITGGEGFEFVGYVALVGLVAGWIALIAQVVAGRSPGGEGRPPVLPLLGLASLALVLFALPFGFGSIFNAFVSPMIRSQNRFSVVIAFLGIVGACLLATALVRHLSTRRRWLGVLPVAAVALLSAADVERVWHFPDRMICAPGSSDCLSRVTAQLAPIQDAMAADGLRRIALFPVEPFAEAGPSGARSDYFGFLPHIVEPAGLDASYSAGMTRGQPLFAPLDRAERAPRPTLAADLACAGYDAVLIDEVAYDDPGPSRAALLEGGAIPRARSEDYALYALPPTVRSLPPAEAGDCFVAPQGAGGGAGRAMPEGVFAQGWHDGEDWGRWGSRARLALVWRDPPDGVAAGAVEIDLRGFVGGADPERAVALVDGAGETLFAYVATVDAPDAQVVLPMSRVPADEAGVRRLEIVTDRPLSPEAMSGDVDRRALSVGVTRLEFR